MSNTSRKLEGLKRDPDTKLLEEQGIVGKDGELTEEGHRVVSEKSFADHRDAILSDLKEVKALERKAYKEKVQS